MTRAALLLLALAATTAHADVWQRAIDPASRVTARDRHDLELQSGDELVQRANAKGLSRSIVASLVDQAVSAYRAAATAHPASAEPYFRIATVIESFFLDCTGLLAAHRAPTCIPNHTDLARALEAVEAWDAFEARAPLDPRLADALFNRAILRTKLVESTQGARVHLEGAMRDYTALLDRADGLTMIRLEQVWGNLAETYMMLGKIEEAIDAYQVAIDKGGSSATHYGKAVALDRDERGTEALEVIRRQGPRAFRDFEDEYRIGAVFFVPRGEEFYYFALINEAFGQVNDAIVHWQRFLKSGAHPQFQPRAQAHLDALLKQQKAAPRQLSPLDVFDRYP